MTEIAYVRSGSIFAPWVFPWRSYEAGGSRKEHYQKEPQEKIDFCLYHCPHANEPDCRNCLENPDRAPTRRKGRPSKVKDTARLEQMLLAGYSQQEICAELKIDRTTVWRKKTAMEKARQKEAI